MYLQILSIYMYMYMYLHWSISKETLKMNFCLGPKFRLWGSGFGFIVNYLLKTLIFNELISCLGLP